MTDLRLSDALTRDDEIHISEAIDNAVEQAVERLLDILGNRDECRSCNRAVWFIPTVRKHRGQRRAGWRCVDADGAHDCEAEAPEAP